MTCSHESFLVLRAMHEAARALDCCLFRWRCATCKGISRELQIMRLIIACLQYETHSGSCFDFFYAFSVALLFPHAIFTTARHTHTGTPQAKFYTVGEVCAAVASRRLFSCVDVFVKRRRLIGEQPEAQTGSVPAAETACCLACDVARYDAVFPFTLTSRLARHSADRHHR